MSPSAQRAIGSVPLPGVLQRARGGQRYSVSLHRAAGLTLWGVSLAMLGAFLGPWSPLNGLDAPAESPEAAVQRQEVQSLQNSVQHSETWLAHRHQLPQVLTQLAQGWPEGWALSSLQVQPHEVRVRVHSSRTHALASWGDAPAENRPGKATMLGAPEVVELQASGAIVESALRFPWRVPGSLFASVSGAQEMSSSASGAQPRLQDLRQAWASRGEVFGADVGMPAMVADLQSGLENLGLSVQSIKPGTVDTQGSWARCPILVRGSGSLDSVFKFLLVASRRAGVISLTPMALVRGPAAAASHGPASSPQWTLDLTVTRGWQVGRAASSADSDWAVDPVRDMTVLDSLKRLQTGSIRGRESAPESSRSMPAGQIHGPHEGVQSRFDQDLHGLKEAAVKAELAWVGSVQQSQAITALVRMRGRVSQMREGDALSHWPWKIAQAGVSGVDLTWVGPTDHRSPEKGAQTRWRLDAAGLQPLDSLTPQKDAP